MKPQKVYVGPGRRTAPRECPGCHERLDAAFYAGSKPTDEPDLRVGDLTICAHCSAVLRVTPEGLRLATQAEFEQMDPAVKEIIRHWKPKPVVKS